MPWTTEDEYVGPSTGSCLFAALVGVGIFSVCFGGYSVLEWVCSCSPLFQLLL